MGERLLCKQEVVGSIPSGSTNLSQPVVAQRIAAAVGGLDFKAAKLARCSLKRRRAVAPPKARSSRNLDLRALAILSPSARVV